jgi:hypothetical protein
MSCLLITYQRESNKRIVFKSFLNDLIYEKSRNTEDNKRDNCILESKLKDNKTRFALYKHN